MSFINKHVHGETIFYLSSNKAVTNACVVCIHQSLKHDSDTHVTSLMSGAQTDKRKIKTQSIFVSVRTWMCKCSSNSFVFSFNLDRLLPKHFIKPAAALGSLLHPPAAEEGRCCQCACDTITAPAVPAGPFLKGAQRLHPHPVHTQRSLLLIVAFEWLQSWIFPTLFN